jgi:hypothetical protein
MRLSDFSTETLKARRAWNDIFQALNKNNCQPRLMYPAKLSFTIEGEIKIFYDKLKLKEFITTKPVLQKILKGTLHTEKGSKDN